MRVGCRWWDHNACAHIIPPLQYPLKPPAVMMYTPSGRFTPNMRLCLSMSDYHVETWNPIWSVSSILLGLQSFMADNQVTAGSIETTAAEKVALAAASLRWNCENSKDFRKLFPELVGLHEQHKAAAGGSGGSAPGECKQRHAAHCAPSCFLCPCRGPKGEQQE